MRLRGGGRDRGIVSAASGPPVAGRGAWYTDMGRSCARRGSVGARGSMLHQQRLSRSLDCMRACASRKPSASCCNLMVYRRCRSWVRRYSSKASAMTGASLAVMLMRIYGIPSPPVGLYLGARLAARGPIRASARHPARTPSPPDMRVVSKSAPRLADLGASPQPPMARLYHRLH